MAPAPGGVTRVNTMDQTAALHTAARHYCLDRGAETDIWDPRVLRRYAPDGHGWPYFGTDGGEEIVLGAILLDVERMVPADFASVAALRAFLLEVSRTAEAYPVRPSHLTRAQLDAAMDTARDAFRAYVAGLSSDDLHQVAPLPYRRVLGLDERERLWRRLGRRWDVSPTAFWYPLTSDPPPPHAAAFWYHAFDAAILPERLHALLRQGRVRRVWELRSGSAHNQYELDLADVRLSQGLIETYWTSAKMDWLIYASHEDSYTIGGEWLLNGVKRAWPEWEQFIRPPFPHQ